MIVFDLKCSASHVFEAWFGSSADYDSQKERGLVSCPMCGCTQIEKAVMAPAVGAKGNSSAAHNVQRQQEQERIAALKAEVEKNCDYVGTRFADEARARHLNEKPNDRGIYGEASLQEAVELIQEGIEIAPLPFRPKKLADA